jgi:hypothetical protein
MKAALVVLTGRHSQQQIACLPIGEQADTQCRRLSFVGWSLRICFSLKAGQWRAKGRANRGSLRACGPRRLCGCTAGDQDGSGNGRRVGSRPPVRRWTFKLGSCVADTAFNPAFATVRATSSADTRDEKDPA